MTPVETSYMLVDTERTPNLDATMTALLDSDRMSRYSVAWIDCLSTGPALGRAVLSRGDHALLDQLPAGHRSDPLTFSSNPRLSAPPWAPPGLLNRATIRMFNEAWFRRAPVLQLGAVHQLGSFFHPLDGVSGWNRLYGRPGFLQYQVVVPFGREEALRALIELLSVERCPSFLGVLKTFGPSNDAPLSFPLAGWTLALDMPIGAEGLGKALDRADDVVAEAGGRVYLAKDSRLRPELVEHMYPRLFEWRKTRDDADPERLLRSDLSRRLSLIEEVR
jgi:decaprenylphospho-beta-D-ribofuranose 2-oxidase